MTSLRIFVLSISCIRRESSDYNKRNFWQSMVSSKSPNFPNFNCLNLYLLIKQPFQTSCAGFDIS